MSCDICGAKVESTAPLRDCYQTDDIKSLCPTCMQIADKELTKLNTWVYKVRNALLKNILKQRHESFMQAKVSSCDEIMEREVVEGIAGPHGYHEIHVPSEWRGRKVTVTYNRTCGRV